MNDKKAYIYKMNLVPANIFGIFIFILMVVISFILKVELYSKVNSFILILLIILYLCLHEVLHGIGYIIGGTKKENVVFGICLEKGIFYCMAYQELTKKNILLSLQMPFMVIGVITYIVGVIFNIPLLVTLSIINICGASMDLAMFYYICKLPRDVIYSESGKPDEFVLISSEDLEKKKNIFFKVVDSKKYNKKDYIFDNIKRFEITKSSIIILVTLLVLGMLFTII